LLNYSNKEILASQWSESLKLCVGDYRVHRGLIENTHTHTPMFPSRRKSAQEAFKGAGPFSRRLARKSLKYALRLKSRGLRVVRVQKDQHPLDLVPLEQGHLGPLATPCAGKRRGMYCVTGTQSTLWLLLRESRQESGTFSLRYTDEPSMATWDPSNRGVGVQG